MKQIVLGITGASGAIYARRLCEILLDADCRVHVIATPHGRELMRQELSEHGGKQRPPWHPVGVAAAAKPLPTDEELKLLLAEGKADRLVVHDYADLADSLSSGSVATDGMAICPCSANTLAAVAAGTADNLLTRAAHVHLKERRPLVLAVREMPVSAIVLENELRLAQAGAHIAPACPAFYTQPKSVDDLVDFVVFRVAACLGVAVPGAAKYGELG